MQILTSDDETLISVQNLYKVLPTGDNSDNLRFPPSVVRCYPNTNDKSGDVRTKMARHGWDTYLKALNGDKFEAAVHWGLAMFNNRSRPDFYDGGDAMSSLLFAGNYVYATFVKKDRDIDWYRVWALNYVDGPPSMPTWDRNRVFVQRFSQYNHDTGGVFWRTPALYYPVVCKQAMYIKGEFLEKV